MSEGSVKRMFDRYDANGDGDLGYDELKHFLKDMGMPHDNHAIQAAMMEVDKNNDGHIKFDEFKDWWSTHKITYVLKRDAGTPGSVAVGRLSVYTARDVACGRVGSCVR